MFNKLIGFLASKSVRTVALAGLAVVGFVSNMLSDGIKERENEEKMREIAGEVYDEKTLAERENDEEES